MTEAERDRRYAGWQDAVRRIRHSANQGANQGTK
jgi:hypothetical protein